jgi:hypothetical protein
MECIMTSLKELMDFDVVVHVDHNGVVTPTDVYGPEMVDEEIEESSGWRLLDGFSGQYGYSGPIMHNSEFIGGDLERYILENPGYYVCLVSDYEGWAIAFKEMA